MTPGSPKPATPEAKALLQAAGRDWKTVEVLLRDQESPAASVCFHAQQYLEKAMKAVLVSNGVVFRRTHDLGELADLLCDHEIALPVPKEDLTRLTPYAVTFRYFDIESDFVAPEEAFYIMDKSRVWVGEQLHM